MVEGNYDWFSEGMIDSMQLSRAVIYVQPVSMTAGEGPCGYCLWEETVFGRPVIYEWQYCDAQYVNAGSITWMIIHLNGNTMVIDMTDF